MTNSTKVKLFALMCLASVITFAGTIVYGQSGRANQNVPVAVPTAPNNAMTNPFQMVPQWPHLGDIKPGAAIGIVPDGTGGLWLQHRSMPAILHINAKGDIVSRFDVKFVQAHGMCRDRDGNFWAVDSGPFNDSPDAGVKGNQVFKFTPEGKLLLTLGQAGVSKVGTDTFVQPTGCRETPDGNILVADGHWPRPTKGPQDGDRLVLFSRDGKYIKDYGHHGRLPGDFMGPHGLAYDSKGRLFEADRSNNRIQVFDKDMNVIDTWPQYGRPSNVWILKDDTIFVSDSESNQHPAGAVDAPEGPNAIRNPGWKTGIRIGSAKDGSIKYFIDGTRPEGLGVDEMGNIFAGLTACDPNPAGGCLEKFVRKTGAAKK